MWDQEKFKKLLAEWIIACDQLFEEVDRAELQELLSYTYYYSLDELHISHRNTIRRQIMKMGEDGIEETQKMFAVVVLVSFDNLTHLDLL